MVLFPSLPSALSLLLLSAWSLPLVTATHILPRAAQSLHRSAVRRTRSLARDLRVAFGMTLPVVPRDITAALSNHVVYCKPGKQAVLGGSTTGSGVGNITSSSKGASSSKGTSTSKGTGHSSTSPGISATSTSVQPTGSSASSPWVLQESYQGSEFFSGWSFFTGSDPTNGNVNYVDQPTAQSDGLISINSAGNAIMRVETTPQVTANRNSVRITTNAQFNGGLVIMDSVHMPTGCGTWPAFWTNGPNWPAGGEIDIVEGVNDYTNNQATIHTSVGCTLTSSSQTTLAISGTVVGGTDCAALTTGNQGCGIRAATNNSFGVGFNSINGGIYAMKWDTTGVSIFFFPRDSEPQDIATGVLQPDTWGTPLARWPASSCDPFKFFSDHHAIFDTTLCGDWASGVWTGTGIPGQDQSCAQRTGFSTCQAFVAASGASFNEAYWEVKSVKIYQLQQ